MNDTATRRFRAAVNLADTGIELMRANLRRRHPDASPDEIDALLRVWLRRRPLDGPGQPRDLAGA